MVLLTSDCSAISPFKSFLKAPCGLPNLPPLLGLDHKAEEGLSHLHWHSAQPEGWAHPLPGVSTWAASLLYHPPGVFTRTMLDHIEGL